MPYATTYDVLYNRFAPHRARRQYHRPPLPKPYFSSAFFIGSPRCGQKSAFRYFTPPLCFSKKRQSHVYGLYMFSDFSGPSVIGPTIDDFDIFPAFDAAVHRPARHAATLSSRLISIDGLRQQFLICAYERGFNIEPAAGGNNIGD